MLHYKTVILESALDTLIDYRGKTPKKTPSGVPLINAKIVKNGFILEPNEFIAEENYDSWMSRGFPKVGDVVLTVEAPLGEVAQIKDESMALAQRIITLRGKSNILDNGYLKYFFMSPLGQERLKERSSGTTVLGIKQSELRKIEITIPEIKTQKCIADFISAYEELIENNSRRIQIIEKIAQKVYTEWFVNFRFPGHEIQKLVARNKLPEGWEEVKLDDCISIFRGKSYSSEDLIEGEDSIPFVNLKCIKRFGGFRNNGIKKFSGTYKEHQKVQRGDLVMAITDMTQERMIVARPARIPYLKTDFGIISMDLIKIEPKVNCEKDFLYAYFRWSDFANNVKNYANGANVLHLTPNRITDYRCVHPPLALQKKYSEMVESLFNEIDTIQLVNENLLATRDQLIPQLVTGKLAVKI